MKLITELPSWYIPLCLVLGGGYAFFLYYRNKKLSHLSSWLIRLLALFRFLVVTLIAFFLLSPLLKKQFRELEKPIIMVAQDHSHSIIAGKDSSYYKQDYLRSMNTLIAELETDYEVATFSFGDQVTEGIGTSFTEKQTDLSAVLEELYNKFSHRNTGALILASDGLYNKGNNPLYRSNQLGVPIYSIALGDTAIRRNAFIAKVRHNQFAYLGNSFPVEVVLSAFALEGEELLLSVRKGDETIYSETVQITEASFNTTVSMQLDANETGIQGYRVLITRLDDEVSYANNTTEFYIEVLDSRRKVLVLAAHPHPDVAALKRAIEKYEHYDLESHLIKDFSGSFDPYSLVILHQLPTVNNPLPAGLLNAKVPLLFVAGSQTSLRAFNAAQNVLKIQSRSRNFDEVQAAPNENFALFKLEEQATQLLTKAPPLLAPFGNYRKGASAEVLFYQKMGVLQTTRPLIVFGETNERKAGVITGEGFWRWQLYDYVENENHEQFHELIRKVVQYLSADEEKKRFRLTNKNTFAENEAIIFEAELYNKSLELTNDPDVKLKIVDANNQEFPYTFSRRNNSYYLNAGALPAGLYRYEATASLGGEAFSQEGAFSIKPLQVEFTNTVADHQLLYALSERTAGSLVYPQALAGLKEIIRNRTDIKPLSYWRTQFRELIYLEWLFFLMLLLLSLEWFLKKRNGAY